MKADQRPHVPGEPDDYLVRLAAQIVETVGISPAECRERLLPDRLRVAIGRIPSLNVSTRTNPRDGRRVIVFGPGFQSFLEQYARAFTVWSEHERRRADRRLRTRWARARSAMATEIDWCCSPAAAPRVLPLPLTAQQEAAAQDLSDMTLRFALCHELAHVALDHPDGIEDLRAAQELELDADQLGRDVYQASLGSIGARPRALMGIACLFESSFLLRQKLALAATIKAPDLRRDDALLTHPPYLHRLFRLMEPETSEVMEDFRSGFIRCNGELLEALDEQCARVCAATDALLRPDGSGSGIDSVALLRLMERSPTGTMRALYRAITAGTAEERDAAGQAVDLLPETFAEYLAGLVAHVDSAEGTIEDQVPLHGVSPRIASSQLPPGIPARGIGGGESGGEFSGEVIDGGGEARGGAEDLAQDR